MDEVTLLNQARDAGIEVRADGDRLHVRGPKRHEALVAQLFEHKAELLALLLSEAEGAPEPQPEWRTERNLDPESVAAAFRRYVADTCGGQMPELSHGALLSRFNLWLEAQGERPTTLPVLHQAMETPSASQPLRAGIARCAPCGGADWGPSGENTTDGAEVWCCLMCNAN